MVCERKFVSDMVSHDDVIGIMRAFCEPDGDYPQGDLESIYFDDPMLTSYWEKANGDSLKRKIRIRWYHTGETLSETTDAFLEVKDRIGAARDKARYRFKAPSALLIQSDLSSPELVSLLYSAISEAGFAINYGLVPSVAIRYRRFRFVCPQTLSRISVDWDIRATRSNRDIFPFAEPISCSATVCEAKSDYFRTWPFCDDLVRLGFRQESFSKYGYLVGQLLQGGFK